ncbi:restriction endonuclease subunit S [Cronobacter dublinensis]
MSYKLIQTTLGCLIKEGDAHLQTGPFGTALKAAEYSKSGVPLISVGEIKSGYLDITDKTPRVDAKTLMRLPKFILREGDIVFGRKGGVDRNSMINSWQDGWFLGSDGIRLRLNKKYSSSYFSYLMRSPHIRSWLLMNSEGTTMPSLNQEILSRLPLIIPSLSVQNKIAEILCRFDEKIEINNKINQTLEQMAQALFKSWFVDFEPVKAKIAALEAGGSQEDATLAAMAAISGKNTDALAVFEREYPEQYAELKATAELFPSAMQESELGEIPEGWVLSEIGAQIDIAGGATPPTKTPEFWNNGDIHWTTPKDLSNVEEKILLHTERKITKAGLGKISSGLLPVNTVLMSSRAPVGYLAIAKVPVAINQGYIAMKCNKELSPEFVLQWCSANMPEIVSRASGTTFAEISKKNFNPIPLVKPPVELVKSYTKQASAVYSLIENNMRENNSLTQLRDTLLPKLLSGEITLPEAEQAVSEAENV